MKGAGNNSQDLQVGSICDFSHVRVRGFEPCAAISVAEPADEYVAAVHGGHHDGAVVWCAGAVDQDLIPGTGENSGFSVEVMSVRADDDEPVPLRGPFAQGCEGRVLRVAGGCDVIVGPVRCFDGAC